MDLPVYQIRRRSSSELNITDVAVNIITVIMGNLLSRR